MGFKKVYVKSTCALRCTSRSMDFDVACSGNAVPPPLPHPRRCRPPQGHDSGKITGTTPAGMGFRSKILGCLSKILGTSVENLGDIGRKLRLLSLQSGHLQKTFPTFAQTNACSSGAHFLFFVNCAPINSVKAWRRPAKMLILQSNFRASARSFTSNCRA